MSASWQVCIGHLSVCGTIFEFKFVDFCTRNRFLMKVRKCRKVQLLLFFTKSLNFCLNCLHFVLGNQRHFSLRHWRSPRRLHIESFLSSAENDVHRRDDLWSSCDCTLSPYLRYNGCTPPANRILTIRFSSKLILVQTVDLNSVIAPSRFFNERKFLIGNRGVFSLLLSPII